MRARRIEITDTTLRDAHQSLWATRMRIGHIVPILKTMDSVGFHSLEVWGGATFDTCLRFLDENPWERLRTIKHHCRRRRCRCCCGARTSWATATMATRSCARSCSTGRVRRGHLPGLRRPQRHPQPATRRPRPSRRPASTSRAPSCYTISPVHTLDHYVEVAQELVEMGADSICIKDMAALLSPYFAERLISPLEARDPRAAPAALPLHRWPGAHDLPQGDRGRRRRGRHRHGALGLRRQPAGHRDAGDRAQGHAVRHRARPGLRCSPSPSTWRRCGKRAGSSAGSPRSPTCGSTRTRCPGGMISNLISQLKEQKAEDRLQEVLEEIPRVREEVGYPPLVTPMSQIVGTQAVLNVLIGQALAGGARRDEGLPARQATARRPGPSIRTSCGGYWATSSPSAAARPILSTRPSSSTGRRSGRWPAARRTSSATRCSPTRPAASSSGGTAGPRRTSS